MTPRPPDPKPVVTEGGLVVFVPMKLVNEKNARDHWGDKAKRAARQRDAVAAGILAAFLAARERGWSRWWIVAPPSRPKRFTFTAHLPRLLDDDGLVTSLVAVRDAMRDAGLTAGARAGQGDDPASGHVFDYRQVVDGRCGVTIAVELLPKGATDGPGRAAVPEEADRGGGVSVVQERRSP